MGNKITHFAIDQVANPCKSKISIFYNSDLCTTNFQFIII